MTAADGTGAVTGDAPGDGDRGRAAHLDASSGVSGDMWLGALVGAGASLERIQDAVNSLGTEPVKLSMATVTRAGMAATAVRVHAPEDTPTARTWRDIRALLTEAPLPADVGARAFGAFERLASAEATVHGVAVEDVHFHEVGALDSIADIIGACTGIADLGITRITVGPVATGGGTVDTSHGTLPVPAPAVVELLRGFDIEGGPGGHELTTPTGAALLAEFAAPVTGLPRLRLDRVGVGAGGRDLDHPNVLRLLVGDVEPASATDAIVLEATVDDLNPELIPVVLDRLREAGAHDAWATPVLMKKGRPGYTLSALADTADLDGLRAVLFRESTTIGARWYAVGKHALERDFVEVDIDGHPVRVKVARQDGVVTNAAPEFEDVRRVADATGLAAREVQSRATESARRRLG